MCATTTAAAAAAAASSSSSTLFCPMAVCGRWCVVALDSPYKIDHWFNGSQRGTGVGCVWQVACGRVRVWGWGRCVRVSGE